MQSVGQVAMDLVLNQRQFNKQLDNVSKTVSSTFGKLKNIAISAFSIVAIKKFSDACENAYKSQQLTLKFAKLLPPPHQWNVPSHGNIKISAISTETLQITQALNHLI